MERPGAGAPNGLQSRMRRDPRVGKVRLLRRSVITCKQTFINWSSQRGGCDSLPEESTEDPLTIGTAGHVDHGKTALVAALTGVDTDRLPQEKARGLTIELGYAPLELPSGRRLSLIDVPGHARFVRTMVSGATGIDLFLMVVASDDGVMPQTLEHAQVLNALQVEHGVVAVTKSDISDPSAAVVQASQILPGTPAVICSARTGEGLSELRETLERTAARVCSRATREGPARLHIDRVFTIAGRGTVVTGTLWSGNIAVGDTLELLPAHVSTRVRGLQVHDRQVQRAHAGQRLAVNLTGVRTSTVARGDTLTTPGAYQESRMLDCTLEFVSAPRRGERFQVMHGTRAVPGRVHPRPSGAWRLRLERPLVAAGGDRLVLRRLAPPQIIGGGAVLDPHPHPRDQSRSPATPMSVAAQARVPAAEQHDARALEQRLREHPGLLLAENQIDSQVALRALRDAGLAIRVSGRLYAHVDTVASVRDGLFKLIREQGPLTLAGARDALGSSRRTAQAFLEHLDNERLTRRLPDDTRVLTPRANRYEPAGR